MQNYQPEKMTFSGFERYVLIVETVRYNDAHISPGDRMDIINELLESGRNYTKQEIDAIVKREESERMEFNLAMKYAKDRVTRNY